MARKKAIENSSKYLRKYFGTWVNYLLRSVFMSPVLIRGFFFNLKGFSRIALELFFTRIGTRKKNSSLALKHILNTVSGRFEEA